MLFSFDKKGKGKRPSKRGDDKGLGRGPGSDHCNQDSEFTCGGQQPGCGVFNSENILQQWPGLPYIPRPEPPLQCIQAHRKWEKEYSTWQTLRCGIGLGYFCRRHAIWIPCSEVRAGRAPTRDKQLGPEAQCPASHGQRDRALEDFGHALDSERIATREALQAQTSQWNASTSDAETTNNSYQEFSFETDAYHGEQYPDEHDQDGQYQDNRYQQSEYEQDSIQSLDQEFSTLAVSSEDIEGYAKWPANTYQASPLMEKQEIGQASNREGSSVHDTTLSPSLHDALSPEESYQYSSVSHVESQYLASETDITLPSMDRSSDFTTYSPQSPRQHEFILESHQTTTEDPQRAYDSAEVVVNAPNVHSSHDPDAMETAIPAYQSSYYGTVPGPDYIYQHDSMSYAAGTEDNPWYLTSQSSHHSSGRRRRHQR